MNIVIYEDRTDRFDPLIDFYPQFFLRLGMMTIRENTALYMKKARFSHIMRTHFKTESFSITKPSLYLSSRVILTKSITLPKKDTRFSIASQTLGFVKHKPPFPKNMKEIRQVMKSIKPTREINGIALEEIWDLIRYNQQILTRQFNILNTKCRVQKHINIIGKKNDIYIDPRACIDRFVVIDASDGPVYIDRDVNIRPFSMIIGPAYIGPDTIIERAKVNKSSIGPCCRIGGEVEACIFQGYANKYHEGFMGHSFIGEWVNLGALTTNSDLKNNYGNIRISRGNKELDSGMQKLGCFIGDHAKTGIGTLIPTGAKIGAFTNFFGGGIMPKKVPSFTWLSAKKKTKYDLEKAVRTAKTVMQRRNVMLSKYYEGLIRRQYK